MRASTALADPEIERARTIARWMDKYGLDPLIGLVPGIGDVIGAAFGLYIVTIAVRRGLSKAVVARMLLHLGFDMVVGAIPVVGDVADFLYKANEKNLALLEDRLAEPEGDTMTHAVDWAYLIGAAAAVVGMFVLVIYGLVRLVQHF
jgi:hypothetical protein